MPVKDYDRLFIGGTWVAPEGTGTIEVVSPSTEEVVARVPDATEADVDKAVAAARQAFDRGPWPRMAPAERGEVLAKVADGHHRRDGRHGRDRSRPRWVRRSRGPSSARCWRRRWSSTTTPSWPATFAFDEVRAGVLNPEVLVTKEPVGVVGAIAPWNVPLFIAVGQARPRAGGRLHGGVQAGTRDAARRVPAGRDLRRGRPARGRPLGRPGRPGGRRAPRHPSRRRQDLVHRLVGRGQADRRAVRRAAQALHARAGREVGGDHPRRRRPRRDHGEPAAERHHEQRAGVHRPDPHPRPAEPLRRGGRGPGRAGQGHDGRGPARPGDRGRPARRRPPARPRRGLPAQRPGRGGESRRRRRPAGRLRQGLLRRADGLRRRRQQDEDRPGGDLRAGARRHPLRRRRRRGRHRQRLQLRALRFGVDERQRREVWASPGRCGRARTCSTPACRSTSPPRSAATRSPASAGSSGPRGSSCSWRRSPSPSRPASRRPSSRPAGASRVRRPVNLSVSVVNRPVSGERHTPTVANRRRGCRPGTGRCRSRRR